MFTLSPTPVKEEYLSNKGQDVLLGSDVVTVMVERRDTKSGSWERGFKFGSITYGILQRKIKLKTKFPSIRIEYSYNHGATWKKDIKEAKKAKGKVILDNPKPRGEFSFEGIQRINREYYGSSYQWKA